MLIIDDSKPFKIALKAMLIDAGYEEIQMFDSIGDAIYYFQNCEDDCKKIKLIFMDIKMPEINGIEAVKIIKANDYTKGIPIIMVTALDEEENIEKAFEAGALDYISKPIKKYELRARVKSVLRLINERNRRIEKEKELEKANKKLLELSITDGLTQIFNRRFFNSAYEKEWKTSIRNKNPLSIVMCDIDYFKNYNDFYGHQSGDFVLINVTKAIKNILNRPSDVVARYGGEEFIILLPNTQLNGAIEVAKRVQRAVADLSIKHEQSKAAKYITLSLGVSSMTPVIKDNSESLIKEADDALYLAKKNGRNQVFVNKDHA